MFAALIRPVTEKPAFTHKLGTIFGESACTGTQTLATLSEEALISLNNNRCDTKMEQKSWGVVIRCDDNTETPSGLKHNTGYQLPHSRAAPQLHFHNSSGPGWIAARWSISSLCIHVISDKELVFKRFVELKIVALQIMSQWSVLSFGSTQGINHRQNKLGQSVLRIIYAPNWSPCLCCCQNTCGPALWCCERSSGAPNSYLRL